MRELNEEHGDESEVFGWETNAFTRNSEVVLVRICLLELHIYIYMSSV